MWVADMFPSKMTIEPDVVGIRDSWLYNVCVEAKARFDEPFEIIGKCLVWQLVSKRVYLAYPKTPSFKKTEFTAVGIGLLEVEGDQVKEVNESHIHVNQDPTRSELFLKQALNLITDESSPFSRNMHFRIHSLVDGVSLSCGQCRFLCSSTLLWIIAISLKRTYSENEW